MSDSLGRLRDAARRNLFTIGYLLTLLATWLLLRVLVTPETEATVHRVISTNLANLFDHPVTALLTSGLVVDTEASWLNLLLIVGVGLGGCLWRLERLVGARRAASVVLAGHVGSTLVTGLVVLLAVRTGGYPPETRTASDFGVSYASMAAATALTLFLPMAFRLPWLAFALGWPLLSANWYGPLPDFTTVGHVVAGLIGLLGGWLAARARFGPRGGRVTGAVPSRSRCSPRAS